MAQIKERAIQFNGHMVRSILAGSKTVSRVAVNKRSLKMISQAVALGESLGLPDVGHVHPNDEQFLADMCPLGLPGDRFWVKEATEAEFSKEGAVVVSRYAADQSLLLHSGYEGAPAGSTVPWTYQKNLRPSNLMPRWACRILLEITAVRIERLQDISDEQCIAEGILPVPKARHDSPIEHQFWRDYTLSGDGTFCCHSPRESFQSLWRSVRGKSFDRSADTGADSWDANPWVWVIEFRRIDVRNGVFAQGQAA